MATEKRLIYLEDAIARIVDTPSDVATMAFEGYYGFIQNPADILAARQHEIIDLLEAVSTVDAVEVVRCKECKHWDQCPHQPNYGQCIRVDYDPPVTYGYDYCSKGERKDNDNRT